MSAQSAPLAMGYARVSTDEQGANGVSLDAQRRAIEAYCEQHGLSLRGVLEDTGVSGGTALAARPAGRELAEWASKRGRHVVVTKLDRLFRSIFETVVTFDRWHKAKVHIHVIDLGGMTLDTTSATGRMFLAMIAGVAEIEREMIAARTKAALAEIRANGGVTGNPRMGQAWECSCGQLPLHRPVPVCQTCGEEYRVGWVEEELRTLGRLWELKAEMLKSRPEIIRILNEEGRPPKGADVWRHENQISRAIKQMQADHDLLERAVVARRKEREGEED